MAITPLEQKIKDMKSQPVDVISDYPSKKERIGEEINIGAQTAMRKGKDEGENIAALIKKGKGKKSKVVSSKNPHLHKPKHKLLGGLN